MTDDLFARAQRSIMENRSLRNERRLLEQECARARGMLRSAVVKTANLLASIHADRRLREVGGDSESAWADVERIECVKGCIESQREVLEALRKKMLN